MPPPANVAEALASRVLSEPLVTNQIGQRFWPSKPTQEPLDDYAVYLQESSGETPTLEGRARLRRHLIQIMVIAKTKTIADSIMKAIGDRLAGNGSDIPVWVDKPNGVHACFAMDDADEDTLEDGRQMNTQTFAIHFRAP